MKTLLDVEEQSEASVSKSLFMTHKDSRWIIPKTLPNQKFSQSFEIQNYQGEYYTPIKGIQLEKHNYVIGITFAVMSSIWYAANVVLGKYALMRNPDLTTFDINFARGLVAIFVTSYQIYSTNLPLIDFPKNVWILLGICNVFAVLRSYPTVWAYQYISASKCILIINIAPVLIVILGAMLLHEKVSGWSYLVAIIACIGWYTLTISKSAESVDNSNPTLGYTFAILSCVARATTSLITRVLCQTANYMIFPFYYSIVLIVVGLGVWTFTDNQIHIMTYDLIDTTLLTLTSLCTTFGMIFLSLGLKNMNASTAAPITNLEVMFAFIADIFLFEYQFYTSDFIGALIIFSSLSFHITLKCLSH